MIAPYRRPAPPQLTATALDLVAQVLAAGPVSVSTLAKHAAEVDVSREQLLLAALALHVVPTRGEDGARLWQLPDGP